MIELPNSTIVNRFLPKEKFYSKTKMSTKLRKQFTDEIEKITGIDFYYGLDKSIQNPVESNKDLKIWLFNK